LEVIFGQLLDAITLGVIFARIAHPKNRARTVFISDSAVIARRDGALKFMFRVADVRQTQVCSFPTNASPSHNVSYRDWKERAMSLVITELMLPWKWQGAT